MEKFKNFLYDKNDIVIALAIVVIAAIIITGRIDAIMSYPDRLTDDPSIQGSEQTVGEESSGTDTANGSGSDDPASGDDPDAIDTAAGEDGTTADPLYPAPESGSIYPGTGTGSGTDGTENGTGDTTGTNGGVGDGEVTPPAAVTNITVTIPPGTTGEGIGQILTENGLVKTKTDFTTAVTAAGADRKLKAGTFVVPSNATPAEIVSIITK